jgi:site-specific recombinase XerD
MYTAFKQYLSTLKLSPVSRKLYLSDIKRFLSWLSTEPTLDQVSSSKSYSEYLAYLGGQAMAPSMLKRTTASLKQFGTFISLTYSLPNPFNLVQVASPTATDDYIKHFTNYLSSNHLSPLTIKSYKSDVSRYLAWASEWVSSTNMTEVLSEKNIEKYLNHLSQLDNALGSTIERKSKSLSRIKSWYQDVYAKNYITDNKKIDHPDTRSLKETINSIVNPTLLKSTPEETIESVKNNNSRKGLFTFVPNFITILVLLVFTAALAIFGYQQFARDVRLTAAFPNTPVTPNRQLSFQGRLEDAGGTPITTATDFTFKLWDDATVGSQLYSSGVCSLTPDTDGVFSTQIGSDCGAAIASSVFTENASVWLEVTVEAETLTPRQPIASVAYALNSETIQGFPISATVSAIRNTVVPMNQWGEIIVGEQSPRLTGVSGTFQISAPALSFTTTTGSNGNITLAPDGTGQVNVNGNTTSTNFFNVNNAQVTTGSLITGTVANNNVGYYLLNLLSGSSPTSKFSVDDAGNTVIGGTLTLPNSNILTGVTNYTQFSQGISVGGATTYYFDGSGNINANTGTFAGTLQANGTFDANGQVDLGDGGDTITLNGSSITLTGFNCTTYSNGGTLTTNASGVVQCDDDNGGSGSGSSNWQSSLGALSPINSTWDVLVGGTATASAKAGFININSGTPTATVSAGVAGGAYLTATGNLATTANQTLTLGNATTGNIVIAPGGVTALTAIGADLTAAGNINIGASTNLIFGGTTSLGESTANTDSGAYNVGVFDEFTYSTNTNVQAVLKDLDTNLGTAITSATIWTDAGSYIYPTNGEVLGNATSGGANKVAGLYLADSAPLTFGTDNDVPFSFSGSTLSTALGVNSWNIASNLLFLNGATNRVGIGTGSPLATLDIRGLNGTIPVASVSGDTAMAALIVDQSGIGDLFTASKSGDPKFVITNAGNVGIGVTAPTNKLEIGGATSTISNTSGDITIDSASNFTSFAGDAIGNILNVQLPNSNTISGVAGYTQLSAGLAVGGNTTYYIDSSGNAKFLDLQVADTGNAGLTVGNGSTGFAKIGSFTIGDNNASVITFDANSDATPEFQLYNTGSATASGDVTMGGQLQVGRFAATPTAVGEGAMIFNTTTNMHQCYNGTTWYNCSGTLYSNTNAAVADGSYITVTHNLGTNDLLSSAWINAQGVWKSLESSYQPAIAWEGKDTQRGLYHNEVNLYKPSSETNIYSDNTLQSGLHFDTFEDETKTDSANTTATVTSQVGDNGSSNYMTLDQRVQDGRTGLMGGQTYSTSTTDNDGQTYLGSNIINDIYYYDRSKDSSPDVQVELGIDPNWYNGVTLSVATSSANYSQNGTIADKNPNLTTTYNGSLIKATGTDSTPRTIYITIKSPTTFDWTNYQGDAATAVTITPGTAQTLGATGVSATFSAATYNVGDVFKIASWYIEGESATRGAKQQFPERSNIIATGTGSTGGLEIIDTDTQKLWMRFSGTSTNNLTQFAVTSVSALNGKIYTGYNDATNGRMWTMDYGVDTGFFIYNTSSWNYNGPLSRRNDALSFTQTGGGKLVNVIVNDVASAVIPNAPTQEVTVSGWGYILGDATAVIEETVNLPYKFNSIPTITTAFGGAGASGVAPTSLESCTTAPGSGADLTSANWNDPTTSSFQINLDKNSGTFSASFYFCYTWTATGTVSPKQFIVAATGNSTSGGSTVINETDGTVTQIMSNAGVAHSQIWQSKVAIADNELYLANQNAGTNTSNILTYNGVHGLTTEAATGNYRRGFYSHGAAGTGTGGSFIPAILGTTTGTAQTTSLVATANTSTVNSDSNTIYVGTTSGLTVIQENRSLGTATVNGFTDGAEESLGSVKYYTHSNISEEMIGDVRGMFPFTESSGSLTDVSMKANFLEDENAPTYSVSGVRGTGLTFDNTADYLCSDADNNGTCDVDTDYAFTTGSFAISTWFKHGTTAPASPFDVLIDRNATAVPAQGDGFRVYMNTSGQMVFGVDDDATWTSFIPEDNATSTRAYNDNQWHHLTAVKNGTSNIQLYMDGELVAQTTLTATASISDSSTLVLVGAMCSSGANCSVATNFWDGQIDEMTIVANTLSAAQIKNMYQTGYRALQSHGTGLGGGSADTNQRLGFISTGTSSVGIVTPDWNDQYMYVGTNSTTLGALSKIQLNSDTNVKTYNSSANVPAGGSLLVDEDVTSLGVGYTLEAAGSAASGVKSMGFDDNSTATSGNFVSKTMTLPKNIGSAVLWVSPILDANDGSNTLTVQASNDGGSTYATCTLVNTNSNPAVPEREYACTFTAADNELKVRFQFVRGSTKTNTYVTQYGISWLGETGFRVEQVDANNTRLYNFSGEAQNLKLNVTGASTSVLASPWTDGGSYIYATGYETLRIYDAGGTNYLGLAHDGTNANLTYNGTTVLAINSTGDLLPNTDDTQSLGSDTKRWKDLFLGGDTLHIGTSTTDEGTISYNTTTNILGIDTDATTNADIAFFTDDLYLDKSTGFVGISTTTPIGKLSIDADSTQTAANAYGLYLTGTQSTANSSNYFGSFLQPTYTATSGNTLVGQFGLYSQPVNSSTGTIGSQYGAYLNPLNASTGTVTSMLGLSAQPMQTGAGTVSSMYGIVSTINNLHASGTVSNAYGVFIGDSVETGTITNDYGLYQVDTEATNYFGGKLGIGTTAPSATLTASRTAQESSLPSVFATIIGSNVPFFVAADGMTTVTAPNFDAVYTCTASSNCTGAATDGGTFTNNTAESTTTAGTAFSLLATGTAANTSFYVGSTVQFTSLTVDIATADVGTTVLTAQYWNGSAWTDVSGQSDGTTNLTGDGTISFTNPGSAWATKSVNGSASYYWIRVKGTTNASTAPTANSIAAIGTLNAFRFKSNTGDGAANVVFKTNGDIEFGLGVTSGGFQADIGGTTTASGTCHSGGISGTNNVNIVDCSGAPSDIAEFYPSVADVEPGDLVTIIPDATTGFRAVKSTGRYDQNLLGAVSTIPSGPNGGPLGEEVYSADEHPQAIGLTGRVPVKVSLENGVIEVNDFLTSSSTPGVAMKATQTSRVIGRALERYDGTVQVSTETRLQEYNRRKLEITINAEPVDPAPGIGKIAMFADPTWHNTELAINGSGDATLNGTSLANYSVSDDQGLVTRMGAFAKATIAQITAGLTRTNDLEVGTISPLAEGQNIEINAPVLITSNNNQASADLTVEGEIDANQISARTAILTNIEAENITARNIIADTISANHIEGLDAKIASLSAGLSDSDVETITDRIKARLASLTGNEPSAEDIPAPEESTASAYLSELTGDAQLQIASNSAYLASADIDFVTINDYLAVIGQAVITDLDVTGHLYASSLNSKTGTLALADNTLIITAGGQVAINGDLTVSGKILADSAELNSLSLGSPSSATSSALGQLLAIYDEQGQAVATIDASGSANLASLTTNMITIASPSTASQSGLASLLGTAQSNATAGESVLVSPNTELTIESPYVTANSLVYLTPTGNTENKVLFVKSKTSCTPELLNCIPSFTVGIDAPASSDITFNWWIIQLALPQSETAP